MSARRTLFSRARPARNVLLTITSKPACPNYSLTSTSSAVCAKSPTSCSVFPSRGYTMRGKEATKLVKQREQTVKSARAEQCAPE